MTDKDPHKRRMLLNSQAEVIMADRSNDTRHSDAQLTALLVLIDQMDDVKNLLGQIKEAL